MINHHSIMLKEWGNRPHVPYIESTYSILDIVSVRCRGVILKQMVLDVIRKRRRLFILRKIISLWKSGDIFDRPTSCVNYYNMGQALGINYTFSELDQKVPNALTEHQYVAYLNGKENKYI